MFSKLRYKFIWWLIRPVVEGDLRNIDSNLRAIFNQKTGVIWKDEVTVTPSGQLKLKKAPAVDKKKKK